MRLVDLIDDRQGVGLPLACRGATCGICRVHVLQGAELLEPPSRRERERLHYGGSAADERYGCQLSVRADAEGEVTLSVSSSDAPAGS